MRGGGRKVGNEKEKGKVGSTGGRSEIKRKGKGGRREIGKGKNS